MDDTIRAYGQDGNLDQLSVVIIDFDTEYRTVDGKQQPRDKVILGKLGDPQYRQEHWVRRLLGERSDDPRIADFIRQPYENWKKGEAIAHDGTPLAALAFIPKRAVQVYRLANIHTAEHLAQIEDRALAHLGMDAKNHRDMARLYLQNADGDAAKTAAALQAADDKIRQLEARLAEMEVNAKVSKDPKDPKTKA